MIQFNGFMNFFFWKLNLSFVLTMKCKCWWSDMFSISTCPCFLKIKARKGWNPFKGAIINAQDAPKVAPDAGSSRNCRINKRMGKCSLPKNGRWIHFTLTLIFIFWHLMLLASVKIFHYTNLFHIFNKISH